MSTTKINTALRFALWRANDQRCFYCKEPIFFKDLEIDHIIPEKTSQNRLNELIEILGLDDDFHLNSKLNLVPTHHDCNGRKHSSEFQKKVLLYYFECWRKKQPSIDKELKSLECQAKNENLLIDLLQQIESGHLSLDEIICFIQHSKEDIRKISNEPLVIAFGLNIFELIEQKQLPLSAPESCPALYDWLEKNLLEKINNDFPCINVQTEPSLRTGETLTIRIAFWNLNVEHLDNINIKPWEILEVLYFSDIYESDWENFFPKTQL